MYKLISIHIINFYWLSLKIFSYIRNCLIKPSLGFIELLLFLTNSKASSVVKLAYFIKYAITKVVLLETPYLQWTKQIPPINLHLLMNSFAISK